MMKMALTGFIIPVYNTRPEILEKTVNDLYKQTSLPIYIIDDHSTKIETIEYLKKLENFKQIQVIHHEKNMGKIEALATGVKEGNVTYPFFIDDDITIKINEKADSKTENLDDVVSRLINKLNQYETASCFVFPVEARNKSKNILTKIQNLEHITVTYYIRKFINSSLYINGAGSLWKYSDFFDVYRLHSKEHAADDLEMSFISYLLKKEAIFSNDLILLSDLKDTFRDWFKQRLSWEYGKWKLFKRYWKKIINNPHIFTYYFSSPSLLLSFLNDTAGIVYSITILYSIFSKGDYKWDNRKRLKELIIYIPFLGLLSHLYHPIILFSPFYFYGLFKYIENRYELYEINFKDYLGLFLYSIFYLSILQTSGLVYTIYKEMKKKHRSNIYR